MGTRACVVSLTALVALGGCGGRLTPEDSIGQRHAAVGGAPSVDPGQNPAQNPGQGTGGSGPGQTGIGGHQAQGGAAQGGAAQGGSSGGSKGDTCDVDLIAAMNANGWFGGEPTSSEDNPCGFQGAAYAFSDPGYDSIPGTADDSVQVPAVVPGNPELRQSPCKDGKCCISGKTSLWQKVDGDYDYTTAWGAGLGFTLNDPGNGSPTLPYPGPAVGFVIKLSGKLSGQVVRIAYTMRDADDQAPFVSRVMLGETEVWFSDVTCPIWSDGCIDAGPPHDLQIQVVGGERAGDYELCVDSIRPVMQLLL